MEFDEFKARSIIRDWQLSEKTFSVWRFRRVIPDKYEASPLSKAERISHNVVAKTIIAGAGKKINKAVLAELIGVRPSAFFEINGNKALFTSGQLQSIRANLVKLRLNARQALQSIDQD